MEQQKYKISACGAYVILRNPESEIFLIHRDNTGYLDGNFALPGGNVEPRELMPDAARREVIEETGIDSATNLRLAAIIQRTKAGNDNRLDAFFLCENWSGVPKNNEPEKNYAYGWYRLDRLPPNLIPYHLHAIQATHSPQAQFIAFSEIKSI
jgi:8-oxo-dGTP pyrophosphatase MutT (NUDIX family)